MLKSTLILAKANAQLLIQRIDKLQEEIEKKDKIRHSLGMDITKDYVYNLPKWVANVRRTSMELTRTLADLRQNR